MIAVTRIRTEKEIATYQTNAHLELGLALDDLLALGTVDDLRRYQRALEAALVAAREVMWASADPWVDNYPVHEARWISALELQEQLMIEQRRRIEAGA